MRDELKVDKALLEDVTMADTLLDEVALTLLEEADEALCLVVEPETEVVNPEVEVYLVGE